MTASEKAAGAGGRATCPMPVAPLDACQGAHQGLSRARRAWEQRHRLDHNLCPAGRDDEEGAAVKLALDVVVIPVSDADPALAPYRHRAGDWMPT